MRMDCADLLRTDRSQFNPGIMVAMVVGWDGAAGVRFVEPGVKVNSAHYCKHMTTQRYWPSILANLPATNERCHFYTDNAPSHVSASTREFIRLNKPNTEELLAVPPSSPDLNMRDCHSICSWPQRLLKCHLSGGRHFEGQEVQRRLA